jgi:hypothetical protein
MQCNATATQRNTEQEQDSTSTATTATNNILVYRANQLHAHQISKRWGSGGESYIPNSLKTTSDWTSQTLSLVLAGIAIFLQIFFPFTNNN